eukprot:Sspe_Gene.92335::Locus_64383_Transcript_2_2_Confidence_0.667_Length_841::g.92335::m.92335
MESKAPSAQQSPVREMMRRTTTRLAAVVGTFVVLLRMAAKEDGEEWEYRMWSVQLLMSPRSSNRERERQRRVEEAGGMTREELTTPLEDIVMPIPVPTLHIVGSNEGPGRLSTQALIYVLAWSRQLGGRLLERWSSERVLWYRHGATRNPPPPPTTHLAAAAEIDWVFAFSWSRSSEGRGWVSHRSRVLYEEVRPTLCGAWRDIAPPSPAKKRPGKRRREAEKAKGRDPRGHPPPPPPP